MDNGVVIISIQFANYLIDKGYKIIRVEMSRKRNRQVVFIFRRDEGIYKEMEEYFAVVENRKREKEEQEKIREKLF